MKNATNVLCHNTYGELGQGNTTSSASAKQVGSNTNWFSASVRVSSVFATTTDRKMFSWGYNPSGTLALGDSTNRSSPTQIGTQKIIKQIFTRYNII